MPDYPILDLELPEALLNQRHLPVAVATLHWIASELQRELASELGPARLVVINVIYISAVPGLALQYEDSAPLDADIGRLEELIAGKASRMLKERSAEQLLEFIGASDRGWRDVAKEVMNEGISREEILARLRAVEGELPEGVTPESLGYEIRLLPGIDDLCRKHGIHSVWTYLRWKHEYAEPDPY